MIDLQKIKYLLSASVSELKKHNPLLIGAAISFYIILAMGPLLALVIVVLGQFFGRSETEGEIIKGVQQIAGYKPSRVLQDVIRKASDSSGNTMAILSSIPLMSFGTTMVFFQLRNALNIIWDTNNDNNSAKDKISSYLFPLAMLFVIELLFCLLILKSMILEFFTSQLHFLLSAAYQSRYALDLLFNYILFVILFASVFRLLVKVKIPPVVLWFGAAFTSFFFTIVQILIGINADNSGIDSALGALGYFTILFLWVFYSSLIFLFGASFTKVYADVYMGNNTITK